MPTSRSLITPTHATLQLLLDSNRERDEGAGVTAMILQMHLKYLPNISKAPNLPLPPPLPPLRAPMRTKLTNSSCEVASASQNISGAGLMLKSLGLVRLFAMPYAIRISWFQCRGI